MIRHIVLLLYKKFLWIYWEKLSVYKKSYMAEFYTMKTLKQIGSAGSLCKINGEIDIQYPKGMHIGNNVHIGANSYFHAKGGIYIGDHTHISRNVVIYSANHDYEGICLPYDHHHLIEPVVIMDNCWIGMNVSITPGVKIGSGAIIGLGAVISRDVPEGAIVGNQPYRMLSERNKLHFKERLRDQLFGGVNGHLLKQPIQEKKIHQISPVFVLSTGRAGSYSITKILDQNSEIDTRHESFSFLIKYATEVLYDNEMLDDRFSKFLEAASCISFAKQTSVYCESDQKLAPFISRLAQKWPNAKFIWLIRDPKKFVNSAYHRGWYANTDLGFEERQYEPSVFSALIYSKYRLQADALGVMSEKEWRDMSSFERNCWYWRYWNELIERQLSEMSGDRWIKFDLDHISNNLDALSKFIAFDSFNFENVVGNKAKYVKASEKDWKPEWDEYLKKWCVDYYKKIIEQ